jgi:hypothetical protein
MGTSLGGYRTLQSVAPWRELNPQPLRFDFMGPSLASGVPSWELRHFIEITCWVFIYPCPVILRFRG